MKKLPISSTSLDETHDGSIKKNLMTHLYDKAESSPAKYQSEIRRNSVGILDTQSLNSIQEPKLYSYRWVILTIYLLADLIPSMVVTTTTPIASQISSIYALYPIEVNLSSLVILIAAPLATYFSSKYLDEKGLQSSIRIGTVICTAGAWMRVMVNESFYFVVAGNFLTGLGAPFISNAKTQVSFNWFSHQQGPGVTSFISFWVNFNQVIGFVLSGNYLSEYRFDIATVDEGKNLVSSLMLLIAISVSCMLVVVWLLFRKNPPSPPSFAAQVEREQNFKESLKKLMKNRNYVLLVLQQGLFLGSISGLATSVSFFIKPFGFDSNDSTLMLGAIPIGGVIGIVTGSYFLNKYKKYKLHMAIYAIGGSGGLFLFLVLLFTENIFLSLLGAAAMGLFLVPMIPAILEFACESVFPIGEGSTVGILSGANSLSALIYGSVMSFIVKGESSGQTVAGTFLMLTSFSVGFFCLLLTKENLIRHEVEEMHRSQFDNSNSSVSQTANISLPNFVKLKETENKEKNHGYSSDSTQDLDGSMNMNEPWVDAKVATEAQGKQIDDRGLSMFSTTSSSNKDPESRAASNQSAITQPANERYQSPEVAIKITQQQDILAIQNSIGNSAL